MKLFGALLASSYALQCDEFQDLVVAEVGTSPVGTIQCQVNPDEIDRLQMEIIAEAPNGDHQKIIKVQNGEQQDYNIA